MPDSAYAFNCSVEFMQDKCIGYYWLISQTSSLYFLQSANVAKEQFNMWQTHTVGLLYYYSKTSLNTIIIAHHRNDNNYKVSTTGTKK